ncbi:tagaturonate reductase [Sporomusa aerivorans]|uniref:tagaturonate reductase n=1 Tax=Sporomusa aerivorans TaxID=204936 RepID=UPI00352A1359
MNKISRQIHPVANLPERVIQFGEGNFLRAFADWMLHEMNKQGLFNGRAVLVQPIAEGLSRQINDQDGLYTLLLRGLSNGQPYEEKDIITSVSRCLNPYSQWREFIECAENPSIEFVISNTTEAGIAYDPTDKPDNTPPVSFPGKLTVYLYHRYRHFRGDAARGMVILPCELIDRNGDNLKKVVLQLAGDWQLPAGFRDWVQKHNYFLNTLVDRVVTGYPRDEVKELEAKLGYQDSLLDAGELFHLWVIEGPKHLAERLPFTKAGLNVIWTEDMTPYRTRKVRILNGAHTSSVPAAFLYGLDTVGEMMEHGVMGQYVRQVIFDEIVPSIDLDKAMLTDFAASVMDRFRNPFIKHYLLSILLNSSSKFKARVLPSILEYHTKHGKLPDKLTFSLAALIAVYKDGRVEGSGMQARREQGGFIMKDDMPVLEFFADVWRGFDGSPAAARSVAQAVLGNTALWGQDLTQIAGLVEKTGEYLYSIAANGMQATVNKLVY